MHRYDIRAALQKKGLTLTQVSIRAGLSPRACSYALLYPSRAAEVAIATALGVAPMALWPSRFSKDGSRRVRRPRTKPANPTISARHAAGGQS